MSDFEELAAEFHNATGKMRPGKDAPTAEMAGSHLEYSLWLENKRMRYALKRITIGIGLNRNAMKLLAAAALKEKA
jgi:hypothetical protein